jgi:transcriptional regulator with GAF, ATPase, and Fis domain
MEIKEKTYLRLFRDICKVINSSLNLAEVLKLITENLTNALNVKGCAIFLWDKKRNILEIRTTHGLSESYLKKGPIDADKSIAETLEGKSVLVYDIHKDTRIQYPEQAEKEGVASILSVPISVKDQIIGVLRIYTSEQRIFSEAESEFISGLADMGGIAIENARMYHHLKADHDRLITEVHQWFEFGAVQ